MTRFLIDTNVISELRKGGRANLGVLDWFESADPQGLYLSALVVGEISRGIERIRRRDDGSAAHLDAWIKTMRRDFADRILPVDEQTALIWGALGMDQPIPPIDGLLAATALRHDMVLVTRNVDDVRRTPAQVLNPFW